MTPLEAEIHQTIAARGPLSIAKYMELCLGHEQHGYYMTRDPLGARGDFVTAPEISQMFGELIGLWAAQVWQLVGAPRTFQLVELGPGRGTLMADALRAARVAPGFRAALTVHLLETSPALRARQNETLADCGVPVQWIDHLISLPWEPSVIIANEFFDAQPVHQAVKVSGGWRERKVALFGDRLAFVLDPQLMLRRDDVLPPGIRNAPTGAVFEWPSSEYDWMARQIGLRAVRDHGAALVIDYGHLETSPGDTFQAVSNHRHSDPLAAPGQVDLTAHVDFEALRLAATSEGARAHGPLPQGEFLRRLGVVERANRLKAQATAEQAEAIDAALQRLTAAGRTGMGEMFKVMAFAHPRLGQLPGFES